MIKIETTKFYRDREELLNQDQVERELGLRRPSVEQKSLDATTLIFQKRRELESQAQYARTAILNTFFFEEKNGSVGIKLSDVELDTFKANKKILAQCQKQIIAIDNAVRELDKLDCGFRGDIVKSIHNMDNRIRSLNSDLEKAKNSTRVEQNSGRIMELDGEIKALENDKNKKQAILTQMETILDNILFAKATAQDA